MEKENKLLYETPAIYIVEFKSEGVICASSLTDPADYTGGTDPFGF